jgi:hypothetical protein
MTGRMLCRIALLGVMASGPHVGADSADRVKPGIQKLECRSVEQESSIRVAALDMAGKPAEGLWIDAISKAYGREQSQQVDAGGVVKLWVARDRTYEVRAYGPEFAGYLRLRDVRVPLNCELQVRVTVLRNTGGPIIIY